MSTYDSGPDTRLHIACVGKLLEEQQHELEYRASVHDQSKLGDVEKPVFDEVTPRLKGLTYGSEEYKASLKDLGVALDHHYANNSHHPEHYPGITIYDGIDGMSLFDLLEMLADWKAAGERHADGSYYKSFLHNRKRYNISNPMWCSLYHTAGELGWLTVEEIEAFDKLLEDERKAAYLFGAQLNGEIPIDPALTT